VRSYYVIASVCRNFSYLEGEILVVCSQNPLSYHYRNNLIWKGPTKAESKIWTFLFFIKFECSFFFGYFILKRGLKVANNPKFYIFERQNTVSTLAFNIHLFNFPLSTYGSCIMLRSSFHVLLNLFSYWNICHWMLSNNQ